MTSKRQKRLQEEVRLLEAEVHERRCRVSNAHFELPRIQRHHADVRKRLNGEINAIKQTIAQRPKLTPEQRDLFDRILIQHEEEIERLWQLDASHEEELRKERQLLLESRHDLAEASAELEQLRRPLAS